MNQVIINERKIKGRCSARSCFNKTSRTLCSTCRSRKSRLADPIRYAYNNLKNRATQRGKEFSLTIEEFTKFCYKYDYIAGKGKTSTSLSVDRKIGEEGYHAWNIQALQLGKNVKKYLNYDWQHKTATVSKYSPDRSPNNPF